MGLLVALAAVLAWDQGGLASSIGSRDRATEVAGRVVWRSPAPGLAGGFDNLTARLRRVESTTTTPAFAELPAGSAPVAELAVAPEPPKFEAAELAATRLAPPPRPLRASRYDAAAATGGTWALVIGINDYPGIRFDLRSAVNDANDVDEALSRLGVTNDRRLVLRDTQAGADTIRAAVDWLTAHAGPDATFVLFYAGHVQKLGQDREALVGADGGLVTDQELGELLDRSPAKRAWIGIAACYGGGFTEAIRPGRVLTAAAPADRVAYENPNFGRSYLVEYMVRRAMLQRGLTTVEGAFGWAVSELQRDYPDRMPVEFDGFGGDLDLKVPPPPAPPPTSGSSSGGGAPPRTPPPATYDPNPPPPSPDDGCANLTVGVVRCE